ncbi:MAG: efflux RND transporter periplasmic adaptor subunit [Ignavibacteriaceae bacterium]|nr:efflux RND transporter periplasmic adaptor subunit [Ignavibacteriaceae bacterium]
METKNADLSGLKIDRSEKSYNPDSNRNKIIGILIGTAAVVIILFFVLRSTFTQGIEVKLITAVTQSPSQTNASLTASGYIVAQRKAAVASKGTGRLIWLGVVEGDKVKKGQIIGRLEDNDIHALLEQAKANLLLAQADLKDAENTYNREKALLKTGSATKMDVDAAEARYLRVVASIDGAKANISSQEIAIENMLIRAPFDGTVLTKNADIGEIVSPLGASLNSRAAVVTMADMGSLEVEADVSESNIEKIKLNQESDIVLDAYPDKSYEGYVAKIIPTADRSKATVMVKVGFKNYDERVLPEMSAKVLFMSDKPKDEIKDEKPALILPMTSIAKRDGKDVVYLVRDEKAVEIPVTTGRRFNAYLEITSGISDGDKVIDKVIDQIKNGIKVKVL